MGNGYSPNSKLIDTLKGGYKQWPNDNPFTTTTFTPLTTEPEKVMQVHTNILEVIKFPQTSTLQPVLNAMSTIIPSATSGSFVPDRDEWSSNFETYRVDEPPHFPGLSLESQIESSYPAVALFICGLSSIVYVIPYVYK